MGAGRLATRVVTRTATRTTRVGWRMVVATVLGALFGWWWDRPGLVRDRAIESPLERRAQVSSAVFLPTLAVYVAAEAPRCPTWLADLATDITGGIPRLAWVIALTVFSTLVVMRRLMAATGQGWPLRTLLRQARLWVRHMRSLAVALVVGAVALPLYWVTGSRGEAAYGHAIPTLAVLLGGATITWREITWRARVRPLRPTLAQVLAVTPTVAEDLPVMPRRGGGLIIPRVPASAIDHLDGLPDRVAVHMPDLEARVHRQPSGAVSSISLSPLSEEEIARRTLLVDTGGLVSSLTSCDAPLAHRPDEHVAVWGPRVTGTMAAQVDAALLEARGLSAVEWDPGRRVAHVARLDEETRRVRAALEREVGLREPWGLEVEVTPDRVVVHRSPGLGGVEKRADAWRAAINAVLPPDDGWIWIVTDDAATGVVTATRVEDLLRHTVAYDWDTPVDLGRVPFGIREDGTALTLGLLEVNQLLGGVPGGGKSGGLTALLCGISRLERVALIGLDPKKVELASFSPRFSRIATEEEDATDVLTRMREEMERRYEWLARRGLKKFGPAEFSPARPLLVLVIDELADLVSVGATSDEKKAEAERSTLIRRLIAKGRAAGIVVIAATQKPQSDVVPTALRDLIQLRVAYAATNAAMTDTILGAGMAGAGGDAHTISATQRGVCYVVSETSRVPVRARTYWVPDEEVDGIAQRVAHLRIDLPWLTVGAKDGHGGGRPPEPVASPEPVVVDLGKVDLSLDDLDEALVDLDGSESADRRDQISALFR